MFFTASQPVAVHTGTTADRTSDQHAVCKSCRQEKAMVVFGGDEMNRLFEHTGVVGDDDSYYMAMDKQQISS